MNIRAHSAPPPAPCPFPNPRHLSYTDILSCLVFATRLIQRYNRKIRGITPQSTKPTSLLIRLVRGPVEWEAAYLIISPSKASFNWPDSIDVFTKFSSSADGIGLRHQCTETSIVFPETELLKGCLSFDYRFAAFSFRNITSDRFESYGPITTNRKLKVLPCNPPLKKKDL